MIQVNLAPLLGSSIRFWPSHRQARLVRGASPAISGITCEALHANLGEGRPSSTPARRQYQRRFKHLRTVATSDLHRNLDEVAIRHLIARYVMQDAYRLGPRTVSRRERLAVLVENLAVTVVDIEKYRFIRDHRRTPAAKFPCQSPVPSLLALEPEMQHIESLRICMASGQPALLDTAKAIGAFTQSFEMPKSFEKK